MTRYSFCMRFLLALLGFVGHISVERKNEKVCKRRKRGSSQTASRSSKSPTQTPSLPMVQDIGAQGRDAVTTEAQVAMVLKAECVEDSECQSSSWTMQASVFCMQNSNVEANSTALTVKRKTRRAGTKLISYAKQTAKDGYKVTAEGQSALSFEIITPEPQHRKRQRRLAVSNKRSSSPHRKGEVSDVSGVYQRGRKMCMALCNFEKIIDVSSVVKKN